MSPKLRMVAQGALWFGALNFGAFVIAAVTLTASGAVTRARWAGAVRILWGSSEAVGVQQLAKLREIRRLEDRRSGQISDRYLLESWQRLHEREQALDARAAELQTQLEDIRIAVKTERERLETARTDFEKRIEAEEAERDRSEADLKAFASDRMRRIYRYMRPTAVAADLDARLQRGRGEEVAAILKMLPERAVADILEAMADPAKRNEIYDLMRSPVTPETEGQGEAQ